MSVCCRVRDKYTRSMAWTFVWISKLSGLAMVLHTDNWKRKVLKYYADICDAEKKERSEAYKWCNKNYSILSFHWQKKSFGLSLGFTLIDFCSKFMQDLI